ncbi:MAG: hypothetical protein ACF8PG_06990 [Maioricimonas sp. JB045]
MRSTTHFASTRATTAGSALSGLARLAAVVAICTVISGGALSAVADDAVLPEETDIPAPVRNSSVLVLKSGKVLKGEVTSVAGGYQIRQPIGTSMIPFETVLLTAPNLPAAYSKLSANQRHPTYITHVQIAQWCADNGLYDEARRELAAAIRLEPQRRPAREMLKQVELKTNPTPRHLTTPMPTPRTEDGFVPSEVISAAGISPELTQDFIRKVQPLMVNKCGNASCHGPASGNAFTIDIVRSGRRNQRSHSERNLAATLRQIDASQPDLSPLLRRPAGLADTAHRTVFAGPRGQQQLAILRNWVAGVTGASEQIAAAPATSPEAASTVSATSADATGSGIVTADYDASMSDGPSARPTAAVSDNALLDRVLVEERADPFDPDIFNRKVHGFSVFAAPERSEHPSSDR